MNYGYLVAEGIHDIEFIGRLLKRHNLEQVVKKNQLDQYWGRMLAPISWPPDGDLVKRMPVPCFYQNGDYSLAVLSAIGNGEIVKVMKATIENYNLIETGLGVGIVADADYVGGANIRFSQLKTETEGFIEFSNNPGLVKKGRPNTGIFIFPDNKNDGTLETVLLKCAQGVYSNINKGAEAFVNNVDLAELIQEEKKDILKPAGKDKAIIGCIGNIFRPGKAIQVSIHDNRWICDETLCLPEIGALNNFLIELLISLHQIRRAYPPPFVKSG